MRLNVVDEVARDSELSAFLEPDSTPVPVAGVKSGPSHVRPVHLSDGIGDTLPIEIGPPSHDDDA